MAKVTYKALYAGPAKLEIGRLVKEGKSSLVLYFAIPLHKEPKKRG